MWPANAGTPTSGFLMSMLVSQRLTLKKIGTVKDTGDWNFRPEILGLSITTKPAPTIRMPLLQTDPGQRVQALGYHRTHWRPEPGIRT